jgi:hypothetical protein
MSGSVGFKGACIVALDASKITDFAGNLNTATDTITRTFDSVAPSTLLKWDGGAGQCGADGADADCGYTNISPVPFTVVFGEDVTGFVVGDLSLANGVASNLVSTHTGHRYTIDVTPSEGLVVAVVPASVAQVGLLNIP